MRIIPGAPDNPEVFNIVFDDEETPKLEKIDRAMSCLCGFGDQCHWPMCQVWKE